MLIEHAEKLLFEAYRTMAYDFVFTEPLWLTWTMERFSESTCLCIPLRPHTDVSRMIISIFPVYLVASDPSLFRPVPRKMGGYIKLIPVNSLPPLMHQHNLHLHTLRLLSSTILDPSTPFEKAKRALERWLALSRGGERWEAVREWEELVGLEMELGAERMAGMTLEDGYGGEEEGEEEWIAGGGGMSPISGSGAGAGGAGKKKKGKGKR